jgi:hypothetical protein
MPRLSLDSFIILENKEAMKTVGHLLKSLVLGSKERLREIGAVRQTAEFEEHPPASSGTI